MKVLLLPIDMFKTVVVIFKTGETMCVLIRFKSSTVTKRLHLNKDFVHFILKECLRFYITLFTVHYRRN